MVNAVSIQEALWISMTMKMKEKPKQLLTCYEYEYEYDLLLALRTCTTGSYVVLAREAAVCLLP
jgi:hypothetical protein